MASDDPQLYSLIYTSRAVRPFSVEEFDRLLKVSRRNNKTLKITGLLVHLAGNFMQVLEGTEEAVTTLFNLKIAKDDRHTMVEVVTRGTISKREFPEWTMAFQNLDDSTEDRPDGFSEFVTKGFTTEIPADHRGLSTAILKNFRNKFGAIPYPDPKQG